MSENKVMVSAKFVTKRFDLAEKQSDKLKAVFKFWDKGIPSFWSVKGVSFDAHAGETIGIIGTNGSGKSTLLEMVAGIRQPTSGKMEINGETSMIAVGAGMRPQLTGRANIRLKALMQGMTDKQIDEKMDEIIEFSELGDFIDQPVKSYSSGMKSKLGFAISVYSEASIIIIDEALSVGDQTFAEKSIARTKKFQEEGKTIFFVSHSANQIKQMADRIIWMHYGDIRMDGPTDEVMPEYQKFVKNFNALPEKERLAYQKEHKDAQKNFTMDDLKKKIRESSDKGTPRKALKSLTVPKSSAGTLTNNTKIILMMLILMTSLLIAKQVMNVSFKDIQKNVPTMMHGKKASSAESAVSVVEEKKTVIQNKYTVPSDMSTEELAKSLNVTLEDLASVNNFETDQVKAGDVITVPQER
ncbi:ATP-binding cassette domain-containing protein [Weissella ceti]|uniref:ATP-binding cassette domain-containing protein n=1 Tax=Weissella ceti TaxID=759620 RepID=A0ABT3E4U1_9LACO|nr:ATP-binding cassette domain-containing protein [Weissella ceti]MCW0953448.1 ATP-binding cassette domain-containing protein [Weissella ceti]QVK12051.1 ATP-binding cassette domain-containing protein [Weissella ceti]